MMKSTPSALTKPNSTMLYLPIFLELIDFKEKKMRDFCPAADHRTQICDCASVARNAPPKTLFTIVLEQKPAVQRLRR
jgi:hypothetical protein